MMQGKDKSRVRACLQADHAVMEDGARLPLYLWQAKAPVAVVVCVHGHNNYAREFEVFGPAEWLAQRGVTVYAYDQRGFGAAPDRGGWAGADVMAKDLTSLARLVGAAHPGVPLYILGQSMGGAVSILAMVRRDLPDVAGVMLAAPGLRGWETVRPIQRLAVRLIALISPKRLMPVRANAWQGTDNDELVRLYDSDPMRLHETRYAAIAGLLSMMTRARRDALRIRARVLFLYGANDRAITPASTLPVVQAMEKANVPLTFAYYPDGWHSILGGLNREVVWSDMLSWMLTPAQALPSQAERRAVECDIEH